MITIESKAEILSILEMPKEDYLKTIAIHAKEVHSENNHDILRATAMLGYDNVCKNQCLYCGMRAANTAIKRYRLDKEEIISLASAAADSGFKRLFLISGEDPKYGFENILYAIEKVKALGLYISLASGEFSKAQYQELYAAGSDEYVLKFEMGQEAVFNRLNPSTTFKDRMQAIEWIKESGMKLASGNIVDYPGQTNADLAEDILLMKDLDISWAPVIPYLPAKGTPLQAEGGRGSLEKNLKEISILRIMMPHINITAQQPGKDLSKGFADPDGNLNALNVGANMLFADILPTDYVDKFSVVDNRITLGLEHIKRMADLSGMTLSF